MKRRFLAGLVTLPILVAPVVAAPAASAAGNGGSSYIHVSYWDASGTTWVEPTAPLFDIDAMKPGDKASAEMRVTVDKKLLTSLTLRFVNLLNLENSCLEVERKAGDNCDIPANLSRTVASAGDSQTGELAQELRFTIAVDPAGGHDYGEPVFEGTALQLADHSQPLTNSLDAGQPLSVRLDVDFPWESTNITQTDSIAFDLLLHAEGNDPSIVVPTATPTPTDTGTPTPTPTATTTTPSTGGGGSAGGGSTLEPGTSVDGGTGTVVPGTANGGSRVSPSALPRTGASVGGFVLAGALLVGFGSFVVRIFRRREGGTAQG